MKIALKRYIWFMFNNLLILHPQLMNESQLCTLEKPKFSFKVCHRCAAIAYGTNTHFENLRLILKIYFHLGKIYLIFIWTQDRFYQKTFCLVWIVYVPVFSLSWLGRKALKSSPPTHSSLLSIRPASLFCLLTSSRRHARKHNLTLRL